MSWIPCLGSVARLAFLFRSGLYIGSRREKPLLVINYYKTLHRGPVALVCKIKGLNSHPLFTQIATALGSPCLGELPHTQRERNKWIHKNKTQESQNLRCLTAISFSADVSILPVSAALDRMQTL